MHKLTKPNSLQTVATNRLLMLIISLVLVALAWMLTKAISDINRSVNNAEINEVNFSYAYLLNSNAEQPHQLKKQSFIAAPLNSAPVKYSQQNNWYELTFENQRNQDANLVLMLDSPMNDQIKIYRADNNEFVLLESLGDQQASVALNSRVSPQLAFSVAAKSNARILIHSINNSAPVLPLAVFEDHAFATYQRDIHLLWGTFIGIVLLMSVYNLVLFFGVRDIAYLLYIGYILSLLVLLGAVHGFGYYLFATPVQLWLSDNIISFNAIAGFFALQFAIHFLGFNRCDGRLYHFSQWASFGILGAGFAFIALPEYIAAQGFAVIQTLLYFLVAKLILSRLKARFRWTKYYLISWVPFFIGAAIGFLLFSGIVPYNFLTRHALMFGVMFEMAFIALALADRLGETERNRLFQASHDFKLGFANENLLEIAIDQKIAQDSNSPVTLLTIEIANYDAVIPYLNDSLLERMTRQMAQQFEKQISQQLPLLRIDPMTTEHKNIAMIRGEMFAFCLMSNQLEKITDLLNTLSLADNFNPMQDEIPYRIHCVFGAAIWTAQTETAANLVNQAKRAINHANQEQQAYCVYRADNNPAIERKVRLAQDLGRAIEQDQLALFHQPQYIFREPNKRSSEVLVRWQHEELGFISPVEFVKIAEETGLIKNLTRWVIQQAFSQAVQLQRQVSDKFNISINVSALDLSRQEFVGEVSALLKQFEISAEHFTLEITETESLTDSETFAHNFLKLKALGFKFAIDDFGTGYSSLEYASDHPFSELKIDRCFVTDLLQSEKLMTIVSATISMAKELKFKITAEGIEDEKTLIMLKALGCDKIQGYHIAKPMPFEEYLQWRYEGE